jgi:hypothetical protein
MNGGVGCVNHEGREEKRIRYRDVPYLPLVQSPVAYP